MGHFDREYCIMAACLFND